MSTKSAVCWSAIIVYFSVFFLSWDSFNRIMNQVIYKKVPCILVQTNGSKLKDFSSVNMPLVTCCFSSRAQITKTKYANVRTNGQEKREKRFALA